MAQPHQAMEPGDRLQHTKLAPAEGGRVRALPFAESWVHLVAGGIGGMTAATLTAPLDVLKTRLQSDIYQSQLQAKARALGPLNPARAAIHHLSDTMQILTSVYRTEGPRALFKGLGPNLIGVIPARSIGFYVYGNGKRLISHYWNGGQQAVWVHLLAGVAAGVATSTATNPIWMVKTRMQLDKNVAERSGGAMKRQYRNSLDCVRQIVRNEGFGGLYKGMSASYLGVAESTLQWMLYEQMKAALRRREARIQSSGRERTLWDKFVGSTGQCWRILMRLVVFFVSVFAFVVVILVCLGSLLIMTMIQVARTRLRQAPLNPNSPKYTGLVQCFKLVWKEEGMMGLYGGLTPHLMRTVPSAAIMFGMYEGILRLCGTAS
ncbi:hypothetical protein CP533_3602 [Ophiocordyceps camponoti-saundersi (nom. inval.)]|nr:hypothetical protein CP533_3602 [Ophiocordyceps camponoti-saundersi (nom. inval.)]